MASTIRKVAELLGLKRPLLVIRDGFRYVFGVLGYLWSGTVTNAAYQGMIGLFCATRGRSNDLSSAVVSLFGSRYEFPNRSGVLGHLSDADLGHVREDIRKFGYHVFANTLPEEVCNQLLAFANSAKCKVRDGDFGAALKEPVLYERDRPLGVCYDFSPEDLVVEPAVQKLISDLSIISVAQSYLDAAPILDIVTMWWQTAFSKYPDKQAAQYFHFDMDRIKWLKFFFYLTDVTAESGPHCFVRGSNRTKGIPRVLLRKGYSRLTDAEVQKHYGPGDLIEFTGKRGTIIAEDTRGLHKGKHISAGDRLMFQLEFTNSLFGRPSKKIHLSKGDSLDLRQRMQQMPRLYSLFLVDRPH